LPEGWEWDETLFEGAAAYYRQGRVPYPSGLHDAFAGALDLSGSPRLLDVGCGPGIVALSVADLFAEVVGVDPDGAMLAQAEQLARGRSLGNLRWVRRRAEELPAGLGSFRCAVFAQSFHWMERERVATTVFDMLEPGGAFVHLNPVVAAPPVPPTLPFPVPPQDEIDALCRSYLGEAQRAGRGVLLHGTPSGEAEILRAAGFLPARVVPVQGREVLERSVDDVVASVFSVSGSAPHLFGPRLRAFEADLRRLLQAASDDGRFSQWLGDVQLEVYPRPARVR
jgi:SAM-dependent methyltransferase